MSDTGRTKEEFAALQRIIDSDPEGTLQRATKAAREHDNEVIRRSDLAVVIRKPDGSIGESVASEAAYAEQVGVPIEYYDEPVGKEKTL